MHDRDGVYLFASAAAHDLLGVPPDRLVGTSAYERVHPDDVPRIELVHRNALLGAPVTVVYRMRHRSNRYVWVETTTRIESDSASGEIAELVCSTRQVTRRAASAALAVEEGAPSRRRVRDILASEALEIVFQPIVDLQDWRPIGFEALARVRGDPSHAPDRLFAEAWRIGLGVPLELLALRTAVDRLPGLPADTAMAINASPATLAADGFLPSLEGGAARMSIEITEHMPFDDFDQVQPTLSSLRSAGGQVAIDDFGAGYASFNQLLQVEPEWIKLDNTLTERVQGDRLSRALVGAVVTFAERAGVRVVAEGIESESQLELLRALGIRYGQGYLLGRPAPLPEALASSSASSHSA